MKVEGLRMLKARKVMVSRAMTVSAQPGGDSDDISILLKSHGGTELLEMIWQLGCTANLSKVWRCGDCLS